MEQFFICYLCGCLCALFFMGIFNSLVEKNERVGTILVFLSWITAGAFIIIFLIEVINRFPVIKLPDWILYFRFFNRK